MKRAEVEQLYKKRLEERDLFSANREKIMTLVAYSRLLVFALGVFVAWLIWETSYLEWQWLLIPTGLFLVLLGFHARLNRELARSRRSAKFYSKGLARMHNDWMGNGRQGQEFEKGVHPYTGDLDIFGKGSLFELMDTTQSFGGKERLADWLKQTATPTEVVSRQEAVVELTSRVDLRDYIASEQEFLADISTPSNLEDWATRSVQLTSLPSRILISLLGGSTFVACVGWLATWWSRTPFFALVLTIGAVAMYYRHRVNTVLNEVEAPAKGLSTIALMMEHLERETFSSARLQVLSKRLISDGKLASQEIRHLVRLVELLDARRNQLFTPVAAMLLWGTQFAFAIEAWRHRLGHLVPVWLDSMAEFDALLALSTYAFEHPDDTYPKVRDDSVVFDANGLGHPLIPDGQLVRNNVRFGSDRPLLVVSGSNMSGKSTLLRAIGMNAVLAFAGAPVRATSLTLSQFSVAASIRTMDSIQDGISRFYAEILRLRQILELASQKTTVLFLCDEILHGTNSHDRRIGAEAVVKGLLKRGAVGLITTHDLELSKMTRSLGGVGENVHFEDHIVEGRVQFDYVMKDGVIAKSNALDLMRSIGLEV